MQTRMNKTVFRISNINRITCAVLAALLTALTAGSFRMSAADADEEWHLSGNASHSTTFKVRSLGGEAYFYLSSEYGTAVVEDHGLLINYGEGREFDHGFYYVYVDGEDYSAVYKWAASATKNKEGTITESYFRIDLPSAGEYTVYVQPMDADTINQYWKHDRFISWEWPSPWHVSDHRNCRFNWDMYDRDPLPEFSIMHYDGSAAYINSPYSYDEYFQLQSGPGENYPLFADPVFRNDETTRADIYFTAGDWIYLGFGYSDRNWRCGFFRKETHSPYDGWDEIPEFSLANEWHGIITQETIPRDYPGADGGDAFESCMLYQGDTVYACVVCDGWYLCRFCNSHDHCYGDVYLWVPGNAISFH